MSFSRGEVVLLPIPFTDLTSVESRLVLKTVGALSQKDRSALEQKLRAWLQL
jgi:hypothetical protein